jgi:hypothetical protein
MVRFRNKKPQYKNHSLGGYDALPVLVHNGEKSPCVLVAVFMPSVRRVDWDTAYRIPQSLAGYTRESRAPEI